ncbi:MAG: alanine racemase [Microthrixaceae bacterium]
MGDAQVCAVVKADGYGHGSVLAARAALAGGATWLAVALAEEGQVLRDAGIDAPVLVLSEPPADVMIETLTARLTPTLYTATGIEAACVAVRSAGNGVPWGVHLKVDTGMHRAGVDVDSALEVARMIASAPELQLDGTFTHFAVADEPDRPETTEQLARFNRVIHDLESEGINPGIRHVSNSAGALRLAEARLDMVRVGIAMYGYSPFGPTSPEQKFLTPALSLRSEVSLTRRLSAGEGVSYGLKYLLKDDATVAVVPLGYADGIDRRLGMVGGVVLIDGVRHPIRGVVTMDQLIVEVTDGADVARGDEVVLLGVQDSARITADDWATLLGTIPYEVLCRFSARVRRVVNVEAVGDQTGARSPLAVDSAGGRRG